MFDFYYVYKLIDPRDGKTFYIGKGKGGRINSHEIEAKKGVKSRKCSRIRDITKARKKVQKEMVACFRNEQDAYDFETQVIADIGLDNLTNVLPGGQKAWDREADMVKRKRVRFLKSKAYSRAMAICIKRSLGLLEPIDPIERPVGHAMWKVAEKRWKPMFEEMLKSLTFDEVRAALRPYGINYVTANKA